VRQFFDGERFIPYLVVDRSIVKNGVTSANVDAALENLLVKQRLR
jgi:hypothetical protein